MLRIGDLANRSGVTVRALRYYEEQHLLSASRTVSGHRQYPDSAVQRVQIIQRLYAAGLSSRAIAAICPISSPERPQDSPHERLNLLLSERERLDREAQALCAARDSLDAVIDEVRRDLSGGPQLRPPV